MSNSLDALSVTQIPDNISIIDNVTGQHQRYSLSKYVQSSIAPAAPSSEMKGGSSFSKSFDMVQSSHADNITEDTEQLQEMLMRKVYGSSGSPAQSGGMKVDESDSEVDEMEGGAKGEGLKLYR